jgi:hypothetical protein
MALIFHDGINIPSLDYFVQTTLKGYLDPGIQPFYRGVGQHHVNTRPSVFRSDELRDNEKVLFDQMLARHPVEFASDTTTLDRLVRMQHHGLPTRLLDITSNPLLALYFAAEKDPDCEGEVQVFEVRDQNVKFPDSDRASVVANLARLKRNQHEEISNIPKDLAPKAFCANDSMQKLLHFIRQEKSYFTDEIIPEHISSIMVVRGKQSNPRIVAQSGAFLLFGDNADFAHDPKGSGIHKRTMKVPIDAKRRILRDLDRININESTVYPGLDRSASYLKTLYS